MLRSLVLATFLLLTLLWASTTWAEPLSSAAPSQAALQPHVQSELETTTGTAIAGGSVITVTTTIDEVNNDGNCSLHEAIHAARLDAVVDSCPAGNGGDTVLLPPGEYASGEISLTGAITIQGSMTSTSVLNGNGGRVLLINSDATVVLLWLEITNGVGPGLNSVIVNEHGEVEEPGDLVGEGGGILNYGATTIAYSSIHGNSAGLDFIYSIHAPSDGAPGGGIYNAGALTVTNSTISNNSAGSGRGGISHGGQGEGCGHGAEGGGIANFGSLTLNNTTVTDNSPGAYGGACGPDPWPPVDTMAGGLYSLYSGKTDVKNSILAGNFGSDCVGYLTSLGHNLIHDIIGCTITGDIESTDAYLGPLQDNGGPTLTSALRWFSPAINAGDCTDSTGAPVTLDQRGQPRPQGDGCDLGAYESPFTSTFTISTTNLPMIEQ